MLLMVVKDNQRDNCHVKKGLSRFWELFRSATYLSLSVLWKRTYVHEKRPREIKFVADYLPGMESGKKNNSVVF